MATNFEEIARTPETLAAFLRSLPVLDGPWDEEFQRQYCAGCGTGAVAPTKKSGIAPAGGWGLKLGRRGRSNA